MAGGADALLIPELTAFHPEWLDSSEISIALNGSRVTGLSFFFHDEASCAEFAARASLDACVLSDEKALREKYSLLPRYWLKIHFNGEQRSGLSHYFHINPAMRYPITTIRCFLRKYGMSDVGMVEELLKPALEAHETQWGLAIKRSLDLAVPRIFFSISRRLLRQALTPFTRCGYLSESAELQYLDWESRIRAGERVFISFDPSRCRLSSLDFCDVSSDQLSSVIHGGFPENLDYLKLRISDPFRPPELAAYVPFRKVTTITRSS